MKKCIFLKIMDFNENIGSSWKIGDFLGDEVQLSHLSEFGWFFHHISGNSTDSKPKKIEILKTKPKNVYV